jgi:hypothetical protein
MAKGRIAPRLKRFFLPLLALTLLGGYAVLWSVAPMFEDAGSSVGERWRARGGFQANTGISVTKVPFRLLDYLSDARVAEGETVELTPLVPGIARQIPDILNKSGLQISLGEAGRRYRLVLRWNAGDPATTLDLRLYDAQERPLGRWHGSAGETLPVSVAGGPHRIVLADDGVLGPGFTLRAELRAIEGGNAAPAAAPAAPIADIPEMEIRMSPVNFMNWEAMRKDGLALVLAYKNDQLIAPPTLSNERVRTRLLIDGGESAATIGLVGMGDLIHVEEKTPSFNVRIRGGPLVRGFSAFKLTSVETNTLFLDLAVDSLLREEGVLTPRMMLVELTLNGRNLGLYTLEEKQQNRGFFEAMRRPDGRLVSIMGNQTFLDSPGAWQPKPAWTPQTIMSPDFARTVNRARFAKTLALMSRFHAGHGLLAPDHRLYRSALLDDAEPWIKDLNTGEWRGAESTEGLFSNARWWLRYPVNGHGGMIHPKTYPNVAPFPPNLTEIARGPASTRLPNYNPLIANFLRWPKNRQAFERYLLYAADEAFQRRFATRLRGILDAVRRSLTLNGHLIDPSRLPNKSINGDFREWAQAAKSTAAGDIAKGWRVLTLGTGGKATIFRQAFTNEHVNISDNSGLFLRWEQTTRGGNNPILAHILPDIGSFANQNVTLSFYARASSDMALSIHYRNELGSADGTSPPPVLAGGFHITKDWQKYSTTFLVKPAHGKSLRSGNFFEIRFVFPEDNEFILDLANVDVKLYSISHKYNIINEQINEAERQVNTYSLIKMAVPYAVPLFLKSAALLVDNRGAQGRGVAKFVVYNLSPFSSTLILPSYAQTVSYNPIRIRTSNSETEYFLAPSQFFLSVMKIFSGRFIGHLRLDREKPLAAPPSRRPLTRAAADRLLAFERLQFRAQPDLIPLPSPMIEVEVPAERKDEFVEWLTKRSVLRLADTLALPPERNLFLGDLPERLPSAATQPTASETQAKVPEPKLVVLPLSIMAEGAVRRMNFLIENLSDHDVAIDLDGLIWQRIGQPKYKAQTRIRHVWVLGEQIEETSETRIALGGIDRDATPPTGAYAPSAWFWPGALNALLRGSKGRRSHAVLVEIDFLEGGPAWTNAERLLADYDAGSRAPLVAVIEPRQFRIPEPTAAPEEAAPSLLARLLKDGTLETVGDEAGRRVLRSTAAEWRLDAALEIPGEYTFEIPAGTTIRFGPDAGILSFGPVRALGTKERPVRLLPATEGGSWIGLAVARAAGMSILRQVEMSGARGGFLGRHQVSGGLSAYYTAVRIEDSRFSDLQSNDGIHLLHTDFDIRRLTVTRTRSDALDIDWGFGKITDSTFRNCGASNEGGDCVDLSGSRADLRGLRLERASDKGLSIGEGSIVEATDIAVSGSRIGIAVKDGSALRLKGCRVAGADYGILRYIKKPYYSYPELDVTGCSFPGTALAQRDERPENWTTEYN